MLVLLAALLIAQNATTALFTPAEATDLTPKQQAILSRLAALPTVASKPQVFTINPAQDQARIKITIDNTTIDANCTIIYNLVRTDTRGLNKKEIERLPMVVITIGAKTAATGLIYHDNKLFSVQPLGDGKVAIFRLDQTKFPKD